MSEPRYWLSPAPVACDVTGWAVIDEFYDARTVFGSWSFLIPGSFELFGVGVGPGRGQRYGLQGDGRWLKIEG